MPSLGHNFTTCNCTTTTTATAAAAVSSKLEPTASDVSLVDIVEVVEGHNQTNLSSEGYNNSLLGIMIHSQIIHTLKSTSIHLMSWSA